MEEHIEKPTGAEPAEESAPTAPNPQNLLEALAEAREETSEHRETFLSIPGYIEKSGIDLLARYRLLSGPEIEAIARKAMGKQGRRRNFQQGLAAALDTMAMACTGIFFQRPEDDEPQPLTVGGEAIINYGDTKLRRGLKISEDITTARGIILAVFSNNELAVVEHSTRLQRWFGNTNAEVDAEFLGEG